MGSEILIEVDNVKKKYCRSLKRSMLYGVTDIGRDILGISNDINRLRKDEFWSLDNVSFDVKRGECLGVIGANGAGKSTLLKMLNGIILPDGGRIITRGRVCALIEIGSGFHPMLSGRENIYINGSILGMSKKEIDKCFDSIVEFAELEESIDMPVKHYSSGMYVRLGFAIAAHVKPDILILDEVLAVGDMAFKAKCFMHLASIKKKSAIILVSHDMKNISRICDKTLLLNNGEQFFLGSTGLAISNHRKQMVKSTNVSEIYSNGLLEIKAVKCDTFITQFDDYEIEIEFSIKDVKKFIASIVIHRDDGVHCFGIMSNQFDIKINQALQPKIRIKLKKLSLMPGNYLMTVGFLDEDKISFLAVIKNAQKFCVVGSDDTQGIYLPESEWVFNNN